MSTVAEIDRFTPEHARLQADPEKSSLEKRVVEEANRLADGHTFFPRKGWSGFTQVAREAFMPKQQPRVRPDDLAEQRARYIEDVLPSVRQTIRLADLRQLLYELSARQQHVIAYANSKGGSAKTPTAGNAAMAFNAVTRHPTLFVDANENDGNGAQEIGVKRAETASILYILNNLGEFTVPSDIWGVRCKTPPDHSVYVVASEPNWFDYKGIPEEAFVRVLQHLKRSGPHSAFVDCGNGSGAATNHAAVKVASTLTFPAIVDDPVSLRGLLTTMLAYDRLGQGDKVKQAFIVASRCHGETRDDIYAMLAEEAKNTAPVNDTGARYNLSLEEFEITPERIFPIPHDDYIKSRQPARFDRLAIETQIAYLEYLVAVYSQPKGYDNIDPFAADQPR